MSSITIANARNLQVDRVHVRRIFHLTPRVFNMFDELPWRPIQGESLQMPRASRDRSSNLSPTQRKSANALQM